MHRISFQEETRRSAFKRAFLICLFVLGLIYLILPGPTKISDFPALLNSVKSNLDGDTWQNTNIVAYYSDFRRDGITKFYKSFFSRSLLFGIPLPIISLNHPPEEAYRYVRDQQESTFLEEYTFPLRETIFVNGYEPRTEHIMHNEDTTDLVSNTIKYGDNRYNSKSTLRYYPSSPFFRVLIYTGMWVSCVWLYKIYKRLQKDQ